LGRDYWGSGYATEAAGEDLRFVFETLKLNEVYSFTSVINIQSQSVMKRLSMQNTGSHFDHLIIPENHPLREHELYKLTAAQWCMNTE
jgi:RimJ/RimL family protein N-acetyltransferase